MTLGQNGPKLNSRPVYCSRLYGLMKTRITCIMPPPSPPIMNEKTIKISPLMHNSMWSHSGMLTNYIVWAKEQLAELLLCFKSEGAD